MFIFGHLDHVFADFDINEGFLDFFLFFERSKISIISFHLLEVFYVFMNVNASLWKFVVSKHFVAYFYTSVNIIVNDEIQDL